MEIKLDKEINGLSLMDYKETEREARNQLIAGKKIVMISQLMLDNAKKIIKQLGGFTLEEEDAMEKKRRKEAEKSTTNNTVLSK